MFCAPTLRYIDVRPKSHWTGTAGERLLCPGAGAAMSLTKSHRPGVDFEKSRPWSMFYKDAPFTKPQEKTCGLSALPWRPNSTAASRSWRRRRHSSPERPWSCRLRTPRRRRRLRTSQCPFAAVTFFTKAFVLSTARGKEKKRQHTTLRDPSQHLKPVAVFVFSPDTASWFHVHNYFCIVRSWRTAMCWQDAASRGSVNAYRCCCCCGLAGWHPSKVPSVFQGPGLTAVNGADGKGHLKLIADLDSPVRQTSWRV